MEFVQQPVPCKKKDRSGVGSESVAGLPGFDPDSNMLRALAGSLVRLALIEEELLQVLKDPSLPLHNNSCFTLWASLQELLRIY